MDVDDGLRTYDAHRSAERLHLRTYYVLAWQDHLSSDSEVSFPRQSNELKN